MGGRLTFGARAAIVVGLAVVTLGLALAPGRIGSPIRRLANYRADSADPIYNWPLDPRAIRRAGAILPNSRRTTYYIHTRPEPQLGHDLIGAALLFFLPAIAVPEPREAGWVFSYEATSRLPRGLRAVGTYRLGPKIYLVKVKLS
jgi:hypothetical protein